MPTNDPPPSPESDPPPDTYRAFAGTCALAASIRAASELSAPGPVERRSGAGRPLTRAYPSAAKPALSSVRKPRQRMSLVRRPSQIASTWMPGRPKTTSAPSASRLSTRTWPPRRVLTRCFTGELFALAGCRSERGIEARRRLIKDNGGVRTTEQVAEFLGISPQAVNKRRTSRKLLALTFRRRGYMYPAWQFDPIRGTLPGLEEVLLTLSHQDE